MDDAAFWMEVKQRRNLFFWWWLGWIPAGAIVLFSYRALMGGEPSFWFMFAVLVLWGVGWYFIASRLQKLLCPRCGKPAISGSYTVMRHAKCQHCGFSHASA
jgi:hypothetical protein